MNHGGGYESKLFNGGPDIDDTQYHGLAVNHQAGELVFVPLRDSERVPSGAVLVIRSAAEPLFEKEDILKARRYADTLSVLFDTVGETF